MGIWKGMVHVSVSRWVHVPHRHPANIARHDERDFGQRAADKATKGMGSWAFLIVQTVLIVGWIVLNTIALIDHWDPAPFILLNLLFSVQAAYAAPLILLSQNRTAEHDRIAAEHDYQVNGEALSSIKAVHAELGEIQRHLADQDRTLADALGRLPRTLIPLPVDPPA